MNTLYLIGGPMGVGKSTVAELLKKELPAAVLLEGDWCWAMDPFVVDEATKAMVLDHITYLLNSFLGRGRFQNIIFRWVMPEQAILDAIISRLDLRDYRVVGVTLVCSEAELGRRLKKDISAGLRRPDILERSLLRLAACRELHTQQIDTSGLSAEQVAERIKRL